MSGTFGLFNQDGAPPTAAADLQRMVSMLIRRGPDGAGIWHRGRTGLGHTLLATTPEALFERQPLEHLPSGCAITADVRLDNRDELLTGLDLRDRAAIIGDAEIILLAYLRWGECCVERLLGDFAFAIWDARRQALFCARDHFGMRPFYYHHTPGRLFAFASEPRAILVLPQTPYRINEARIADFLVPELEGIDKTSSFFEEVYRLPPAHTLTVSPQGVRQRRYWALEPGPELRLPSDEAYAEAFLEGFTEAVRCRLRGPGPVGSMLSGGMDSCSVVAVASALLTDEGRGPLSTFSATAPDAGHCIETRTIHAAQTMPGLNPCTIPHSQLDPFLSEIEELTWHLDEPFDHHMTLPRVIYLAAQRRGIHVMLDGAGGDSVLSEGSHLARLLRRGRWVTAYREAVGLERFWGSTYPAWRQMYHSARSAFVPNAARRLRHRLLGSRHAQRRAEQAVRESIISPQFARRVSLAERLQTLYLNQVLPRALSRQGQLIFHASAVEANGGAIAFMGGSGWGKSTLAASFATNGCRFLTDDGLVVEAAEGGYRALPSHPSVRLWEDSREVLIGGRTRAVSPVQFTSKLRFLADDTMVFCAEPKPLDCVYFLGEGAAREVTFVRMSASEALIELLKHAFVLDIEARDSIASHFDRLAHLARLPIHYRLDYARRFERLRDVRQAVLSHCGRCAAPAADYAA